MTNGADHGIGVTCKPGLTGEYGCADNYYTYAGTQIWSVGPVPATNGQTSGTVNWSILDSANSNFVRFNLVNGGAADINAYGSNAFSVNRYTNAGTLGFRVYSGGATPTQVGAIDSSGNLTLSGSVKVATGRKGTFVCTAAGTITITNANETVTSDVVISLNTTGGTITTPPAMKTVTAGASFTVLCGASDTSTYNYDILN